MSAARRLVPWHPLDREFEAHAENGGGWTLTVSAGTPWESSYTFAPDETQLAKYMRGLVRAPQAWTPHDRNKNECAWPTATGSEAT